jgi:hypothetical protein
MPTGGGEQIEIWKLIKELLQLFVTNLRKKISVNNAELYD